MISAVTDGSLSGQHDALLVDLDGTLFRGAVPIPGASQALESASLPVIYVTNNASRAPADTASHLRELGFAAQASEVMTSAQAAVVMLADHVEPGSRVLVVGHDSFRALVNEAGYRVVLSADDEPSAVLQGLSRDLNWADLAEGCLALHQGVPWIASNVDTTLPAERGLLPGNGALVAALREATGRVPLVAGKPAAGVLHAAAHVAGASHPLVVGDRLDTDIEGAVAAGMQSLLVLTGVNGTMDLLRAPESRRATHVGHDLSALSEPSSASCIADAADLDVEVRNDALFVQGIPDDLGALDLARSVIRLAWHHDVAVLADSGPDVRSRLTDAGLTVG